MSDSKDNSNTTPLPTDPISNAQDLLDKLPFELRAMVCGYLIPSSPTAMQLCCFPNYGPGKFLRHEEEYVVYESLSMDGKSLRCTSRTACHDWESRYTDMAKLHPLTMRLVLEDCPETDDYGAEIPLSLPEIAKTFPHDRPYYYAKSWVGLLLTAALKARQFHCATEYSLFSFPIDQLDALYDTCEQIAVQGLLVDTTHVHSGHFKLDPDFGMFIREAAVRLLYNRQVHVFMTFPGCPPANLVMWTCLLHDLRYVADNKLLDVHAYVDAPDVCRGEWQEWIERLVGRIHWHFL